MRIQTKLKVAQNYSNWKKLTTKQIKAIELLIMGKHNGEVAQCVGVRRETVWRWQNQDSDFIAVFNQCNAQRTQTLTARFNGLFLHALDLLEEAIKQGDANTALALVQALKPTSVASTEIGSNPNLPMEPDNQQKEQALNSLLKLLEAEDFTNVA